MNIINGLIVLGAVVFMLFAARRAETIFAIIMTILCGLSGYAILDYIINSRIESKAFEVVCIIVVMPLLLFMTVIFLVLAMGDIQDIFSRNKHKGV